MTRTATKKNDLAYRELAAILAGLRYLQAHPDEMDEMVHFTDCAPLTDEEFDTLCDKLNGTFYA